MTENNKKTLPVVNNNGVDSSKKRIQNPCKETSPGCGCGAASCENCPGSLGMNVGSDREVVCRNVFSYLKIVIVILVATYILKEALTSLPA